MKPINLPESRDRNIYLAKQVNQETINAVTKEIIEINEADDLCEKLYSAYNLKYTRKPIKFYIDSYGGAVYQCFGLLGIMERSKTPIHTIVTGCAMSCGFLIAIAGHKRFGYDLSTYLYHQVSSSTSGKLKEIEEDVAETQRLQKLLDKHVLKRTEITKDDLKKSYKRKTDWFINTKDALKMGIIDEVI